LTRQRDAELKAAEEALVALAEGAPDEGRSPSMAPSAADDRSEAPSAAPAEERNDVEANDPPEPQTPAKYLFPDEG
jgi:hypothetical protein